MFQLQPISGRFSLVSQAGGCCWSHESLHTARAQQSKLHQSLEGRVREPQCLHALRARRGAQDLPGYTVGSTTSRSGSSPYYTGQGDQRSPTSTEALLCPGGRLERAHRRSAQYSRVRKEAQETLPDQKTLSPDVEEVALLLLSLKNQKVVTCVTATWASSALGTLSAASNLPKTPQSSPWAKGGHHPHTWQRD